MGRGACTAQDVQRELTEVRSGLLGPLGVVVNIGAVDGKDAKALGQAEHTPQAACTQRNQITHLTGGAGPHML